ncbi:YeeE/YedE family protein [Palleronia pelagia]|uniref:YeeE/YedE family protein n=1 Tax=Palleronia pelagia TaxID=387096 RepID=UPI0011142CAC|nr:YeeE/YedE family protein [Palleronia pelagia]
MTYIYHGVGQISIQQSKGSWMEPVVATPFTPWLSLFGGILIGLAAVMVMGLFGKIAGITGISKGLTSAVAGTGGPADRGWRFAVLLGLIAAPLAVLLATGSLPQQTVPINLWGMALAGLLVGFGTAFGSGCTSGHGVCGLARLSPRSAAAVATFLVAAVATTTFIRHAI